MARQLQVVEGQLNHNMTCQVPVQKFTSLGVKLEMLGCALDPSLHMLGRALHSGLHNKVASVLVQHGVVCCFITEILVTKGSPSYSKGLFTWREGAPANRATRLTELPWAG